MDKQQFLHALFIICSTLILIIFPQGSWSCSSGGTGGFGTRRRYYIAEVPPSSTPASDCEQKAAITELVLLSASPARVRKLRSTTTSDWEYVEVTEEPITTTTTTITTTTTTTTTRPPRRRTVATTTTTTQRAPLRKTNNIVKYKCGTIPSFFNQIDASQTQAERNEIPWQVRLSIVISDDEQPRVCGGALVANGNTVITAASCLSGISSSSDVVAILGDLNRNRDYEPGEQRIGVTKIYKHPLYEDDDTNIYDIAVLIINDVELAEGIVPACLPASCRTISNTDYCIVSGWRSTLDSTANSLPYLQKAESHLVQRQSRCNDVIAPTGRTVNNSQTLCSEVIDHDSHGYCQLDTGGPIVCRVGDDNRFALEGVQVFHTKCEMGSNDVYMRVCVFSDWITSVMSGRPPVQPDFE